MTSNTFITFNVYSCCNWCLSQLNAERMILINGDLKKIFAGGITYESEAVLKQLYMLTVVMHMEQQHVLVKIVLFL